MKELVKGIAAATILAPVASIIYQLVAWVVYNFNESELTLADMLLYRAMNAPFVILTTLIFITVYGLPIFLLLRKFNLANIITVAIVAITPWVIIDGFINKDIHHFIEFSWHSIVTGVVFWFFAKRTILYEPTSA